jgi:hypothetical protein
MPTVIATSIRQIKLAPGSAMAIAGLIWKTCAALLQELGDDRSTQIIHERAFWKSAALQEIGSGYHSS